MNKETLRSLASNRQVQLGLVATFSLLSGAGAGYVVAEKRLKTKYEMIVKQEIEDAKKFYALQAQSRAASEKPMTPAEALENSKEKAAADALTSYQGGLRVVSENDSPNIIEALEQESNVETAQRKNIFSEPESEDDSDEYPDENQGWDYETELARRSGDKPYVITHDEYFEGDKEYEQVQLTYFELDDVLCDDRDQPVPDTEATVGDDNLTRFGTASKDPNVVYIRNDARDIDFEVVRSTGSYSKEVLGFDDTPGELEHSMRRGRSRRARDGDDE